MRDLTGERYGRLVVQSFVGINKNHQPFFSCLCDCGKVKSIRGYDLISKATQSCGCLFRERITIHNLHNHPLYGTVKGQKYRCENKKHDSFHRYGGRGIEFRFKSILEAIEWVENNLGPRPEGMTIDRKDNNGHYEPGNLRWATKSEQSINKENYVHLNKRQGCSSSHKGVYWDKSESKWRAYFYFEGKTKSLGRFNTEEEAVIARAEYEKSI